MLAETDYFVSAWRQVMAGYVAYGGISIEDYCQIMASRKSS